MFTLMELPYLKTSLEPYMSAKTLAFHYSKHHQAYADNLNKLIAGTDLEKESLENIILKTFGIAEQSGIFNNAAQYYNHNFFWKGLCPFTEKSEPSQDLLVLITKNFGSLELFYTEFKIAAAGLFGSGWVWLVKDGEILKIIKTFNADTPLTHNLNPLWGLDVWEHAYYLDYQNKRADFTEAILKNLINWKFVSENL